MSDKRKEDRVYITTPKGVAVYPWLNKPDTKFDKKGGGNYHVKQRLEPSPELDAIIEKINAAADAKMAEVEADLKEKKNFKSLKALTRYVPYASVYDEEGNETAAIEISAKMAAVVTPGNGKEPFTQKPALFDSKGKLLAKPPAVYGGSEVKINAQVIPFYNSATNQAGATLRLRGVQIIKLVVGGSADAKSFGFGEEEGFEQEPEEEVSMAPAAEAEGDGFQAGGAKDF